MSYIPDFDYCSVCGALLSAYQGWMVCLDCACVPPDDLAEEEEDR